MVQPRSPACIPVVDVRAKRVLKSERMPILTYTLSRPTFPGMSALERTERYYRDMAQIWKARWEGSLFRQALAAARKTDGAPFPPWNCILDYTVTLRTDGMLSLYADALEETGTPHPLRVRCADTWLLPSGAPCALPDLLGRHWRSRVLKQAAEQIRRRLAGGEAWFYPDWERRLPHALSPERFYCTQDAVCIYFSLCSLAPWAEGIPVITLPLPKQEDGGTFL